MMVKDIKVKVVKNNFGYNLSFCCSDEEYFKGLLWIKSRVFLTKIEAELAASVCKLILQKYEQEEHLSDIDFPITKWCILTKAVFYLLDTPNKDVDF